MQYTEVISRIYDSLAIIEYEKINEETILIHNIKSSNLSATAELEALDDFINDFRNVTLLIDITRLAGHRKALIEQAGFNAVFDSNLPVFATHKLLKKED